MESRAHSALIGAFALVATALFLIFIAWFSKAEFDQQVDRYEVNFTGPIRGLSAGSEVRFNGLRAGEVVGLRLSKRNANLVIADVEIDAGTRVSTDSYAQLEPLGLTGLNYIQIFGGKSGVMMTDSEQKQPYKLQGRMSQFETFLDGGGSLITGAQNALNRANTIMSEQAIEDFHSILANTRVITRKISEMELDPKLVNATLRALKKAAEDVSLASEAVDIAADDFDKLIEGEVKAAAQHALVTMKELDETLNDFSTTAQSATALTEDTRDAINRLSNSGLTDLEEAADAFRGILLNLESLIEKLEKNPIDFIAGEETETLELPK